MDPDDVKIMLQRSGADVWSLIEGAVAIAVKEHAAELRRRRDGILELMYGGGGAQSELRVSKAEENGGSVLRSPERRLEANGSSSPVTSQSFGHHEAEEEEEDVRVNVVVKEEEEEEEEQVEVVTKHENEEEDQGRTILAIRDFLEDLEQPEESLIQLLQNLEDMDITFKTLKETDIGKYVSALKKHPSSEVRRLSKQLIKKWKEMVDEWARKNKPASPSTDTWGYSPQQIFKQNSHHVVPDSANPSSLHNRSSMLPERLIDSKSNWSATALRRPDPPLRRPCTTTTTASPTPPAGAIKEQEDRLTDPDKLEVARKRLHMNYQRKADEKKQRTIQVMEITDIPRGKNTFIARNKIGVKNHHR